MVYAGAQRSTALAVTGLAGPKLPDAGLPAAGLRATRAPAIEYASARLPSGRGLAVVKFSGIYPSAAVVVASPLTLLSNPGPR